MLTPLSRARAARFARMKRVLVAVGLTRGVAHADPDEAPAVRKPDATAGEIFGGPFTSSRLFAMPVADVVGAYMVSASFDGSLLQQPGVLTSEGALAIGFGDLAQLEYRHTEVVSVTGVDAPVPTVGAQLELPIPARPNVPALAVAYRQGLTRSEQVAGQAVNEKDTDVYVVMRERFAAAPWLTLHAGMRIALGHIDVSGGTSGDRTLVLPTGGIDLAMSATAHLIAEAAQVPSFTLAPSPSIGKAVLARIGLRWRVIPAVSLDASLGYQRDAADAQAGGGPRDIVQQWDIRLGVEVFVPWGALACRALGAFCE
jgi:hypothetical protein